MASELNRAFEILEITKLLAVSKEKTEKLKKDPKRPTLVVLLQLKFHENLKTRYYTLAYNKELY